MLGTIWLMVAAVLGPVAWFWLRKGRVGPSAALAAVSAMLIYWNFFGAFLPGLGGLRISERVETATTQAVNCSSPTLSVAGYPEESAAFISGPSLRFVDAGRGRGFSGRGRMPGRGGRAGTDFVIPAAGRTTSGWN